MAWNDGSRFLIAHGVAWGKGPKVYKGSTRDTDWNKVCTLAPAHQLAYPTYPLPPASITSP